MYAGEYTSSWKVNDSITWTAEIFMVLLRCFNFAWLMFIKKIFNKTTSYVHLYTNANCCLHQKKARVATDLRVQ